MDLGVASHHRPSCRLGIVLGSVAWAKGGLKHKQGEDAALLRESSASHCGGSTWQEAAEKAGHYISALPSPSSWRPPLVSGLGAAGTPNWLGLVCLCGQDLPTMWPKPATSIPLSFQIRNCLLLLPLLSTVASAPTDLPGLSPVTS